MERFNQLPFPQKVLVLVFVMAVVAGLFYYGLIMPLESQQAEALSGRTNLEKELAQLRQELEPQKERDLKAEREKLESEKTHFEEMLPRREDLVKFITGLSETAKNAGLQLHSFNKGKPNVRDYYLEIPIKMEVRGTYRELIGFLRTISERDQRVVNIRGWSVKRERLDADNILARYMAERAEEHRDTGRGTVNLSPLQRLMLRVKAIEESVGEGAPLKAEFTAYVFTYTGQLAPPEAARTLKQDAELIRQRRKETLLIL